MMWTRRLASSALRDGWLEAPVARVIGIIIGMAGGILLARSLGPEGRGRFAIAATILGLGVQVTTLGMHASLPYFIARRPGSARSALIQAVRWMAYASLLFAVGLLVWCTARRPVWRAEAGWTLVFGACVAVPMTAFQLLSQAALLGVARLRPYNWSDPLARFLTVVAFVVLAALGSLQPLQALMSSALVAMLVGGGALSMLSRLERSDPLSAGFREQFPYMWKSLLTATMVTLPPRLLTLTLPAYVAPAEVGQWGVALTIVDTIAAIMASIIAMQFNPMVRQARSGVGFGAVCASWIVIVFLISLALTLAACLVAPWLVPLVFGAAYVGVAPIALCAAVGAVAYSTTAMSQAAISACGQPWHSLLGPGAAILVTLFLIYANPARTADGFAWIYSIQASAALVVSVTCAAVVSRRLALRSGSVESADVVSELGKT